MMIWRGLGTGQLTRLMQDARDLNQTAEVRSDALPQPQPKAPPSETAPSFAFSSAAASPSETVAPLPTVREAVPRPLATALAASPQTARTS